MIKLTKTLAVLLIVLTLCMSAASAGSDLENSIYADIQFGKHPHDHYIHYVTYCGYSEAEWYAAAVAAMSRAVSEGRWPDNWENVTPEGGRANAARQMNQTVMPTGDTPELGDETLPMSVLCGGALLALAGAVAAHRKRCSVK